MQNGIYTSESGIEMQQTRGLKCSKYWDRCQMQMPVVNYTLRSARMRMLVISMNMCAVARAIMKEAVALRPTLTATAPTPMARLTLTPRAARCLARECAPRGTCHFRFKPAARACCPPALCLCCCPNTPVILTRQRCKGKTAFSVRALGHPQCAQG